MSGATRNFLILILVNLMWALQFPAAKFTTARLGPITVAALPLGAATLILAPLLLFRRGSRKRSNQCESGSVWKSVLDFAILGIAGTILAQLFLTWGVQRSLASNASVITLTIPVLSAILAAAMLGERMSRLRWISFILAVAGVFMVSQEDFQAAHILHGKYLVGNLLLFASCWGSAFYNVFSKKLLDRFDPLALLVYSFVASDLILLPMMFAFERPSLRQLASLDAAVWASLAVIAVFSLALAMMLFLWVLEKLQATQVSLSVYLLPVFGVILSALTLNEKITLRLFAGAMMVLAGTFLVTVYEEKKSSGSKEIWPREDQLSDGQSR